MSKINNVGRRTWALLLAVALVVGLLPPVQVRAEGTGESPVATPLPQFTVEAKRVENEEGAEKVYTYSAKVKQPEEAEEAEKVTFAWTADESETGKESVFATDNETAKLRVQYQGLVLKMEVSDKPVTKTWGLQTGTEIVGKPLSDRRNPVLMAGSGVAEDATWRFEKNPAIQDDYIVPVVLLGDDMKVGTYTLTIGEYEYTVDYLANVNYADVDVTYSLVTEGGNVPIENEWYTAPQTVLVTASTKEVDAAYLPPVTLDGKEQTADWDVTDGAAKMSITVSGDGEHRVAMAGASETVKIDSQAPVVSGAYAYKKNDAGEIVVYADITDATSGVASITIGGETFDEVAEKNLYTISGDVEVPFKIVATDKAGLTCGAVTVALQDELSVFVQTKPEVYGNNGVNSFLENADDTIVFQVSGYDNEEFALVNEPYVDIETTNPDTTYVWDRVSGTVTVQNVLGVSQVTVSATDKKGRSSKEVLAVPAYAVDDQKPTVALQSREAADKEPVFADGVEWHNAAKNNGESVVYTFKADDYAGIDKGKSYIAYMLNGEEKTASFNDEGIASIVLKNGDSLSAVRAYVVDICGNEAQEISATNDVAPFNGDTVKIDTVAPVVELTISDAVKGVYNGTDGSQYAIMVQPVEYKNGQFSAEVNLTETVVITAKVTDNNGLRNDGSWTYADGVYTASAQKEVDTQSTENLEFSFQIMDLAGNIANNPVLKAGDNSIVVTNDKGTVSGSLRIDRRTPSSIEGMIPEVTVKPSEDEAVSKNDVFIGSKLNFDLTVYEAAENDSGIKSISAKFGSEELAVTGENAPYVITGEISENTEIQKTLTVTVEDNVGNRFIYTNDFVVDNQAPRIKVEGVENGAYYDGTKTATITFTDMHLKDGKISVTVDGAEQTVELDENNACKIPFEADGEYTLVVNCTDAYGHEAAEQSYTFTVDNTDPAITVSPDPNGVTGEITYVQKPVEYKITVQDTNLSAYEATYSLDNSGDNYSIDLSGENGKVSGTFTLEAGQVLTGITVTATDEAGRDSTYKMTGAHVAVDGQAPNVTLTKTIANEGKLHQSRDGVDYYNQPVTYTVLVEDQFLNDGAEVVVKTNESENPLEVTWNKGNILSGNDTATVSFTVENDAILKGFSIFVKDAAGRVAEEIVVKDPDNTEEKTVTDFSEKADNSFAYQGNAVHVDTVAPVMKNPTITAELVDENDKKLGDATVTNFYAVNRNGNTEYYAYIEPVVVDGNNRKYDNADVRVTFACELEEKNPDAAKLKNGWSLVNGTWIYSSTVTIKPGETGALGFDFKPLDMAGNITDEERTLSAEGENQEEYPSSVILSPDGGSYRGTIYLDRDTPEVALPSVVVSAENYTELKDGSWLFNKDFSFNVTIQDQNGNNSGIKSAFWSMSDGIGNVLLEAVDNESIRAGENELKIKVKDDAKGETASAQLKIVATDYVGNIYTFVKDFCFDNLGARIAVEKVNEGKYIQTLGEAGLTTDFYNGPVSYKFVMEDMFIDAEDVELQYKLNGVNETAAWTAEDGSIDRYETVIRVDNLDVLSTIQIKAKDNLGNPSSVAVTDSDNLTSYEYENSDNLWTYTGNAVEVDMDKPEIKVEKTGEAAVVDGTYYFHNKEFSYKFKITDANLSNQTDGEQKLELKYQFETDEGDQVVTLGKDGGWTFDSKTGTYSYELNVTNGKVLKDVQLTAVDNAGNSNSWAEDKKPIVVDTKPAEVTVKKTGTLVQTDNGYDYFNSEVEYKVTVKDQFLTDLNPSDSKYPVAQVELTFMDDTTETEDLLMHETSESKAEGKLQAAQDIYEWSYTVKDEKPLKSFNILVKDNSGNVTRKIDVNDETKSGLTYTYNEEKSVNESQGKIAVVDTKAPDVSVELTGNINGFYVYDGIAYVEMKEPVNGLGGWLSGLKDEKIEICVKVSDNNLTLDANNPYPVMTNIEKDMGTWSGTTGINEYSTVVYTKEVSVEPDKTGVIKIDLTIFDMAGHGVKADNSLVKPINDTIVPESTELFVNKDEVGLLKATFSVDRRRPTSAGDDNRAPEIVITPTTEHITTSRNGLELFAEAFDFNLNVTDGKESENNSGIQNVIWNIEDPTGFVVATDGDVNNKQENGTYVAKFSIPVKVNKDFGETNSAKITVTAVDNVGNTVTYVKNFAVDTQDPRVVVTYSNNDVRNERYFKEDRTATITITDINFNPETTAITTEVTPSAWTQNGDTWTAQCVYATDGEYTLAVASTDLTEKNVTTAEEVNYDGAAPRDFVIDKTAPVINVTYDPIVHDGTEPNGVLHYDEEVTATVTIEELNFNPVDVQADMGAGRALDGWTTNDIRHTSHETYGVGNNYRFSVNYTDLAGNPANGYESPSFSVDMGAPKIEISRGEMTNQGLNYVQGDLSLGFTITDSEENLENFNVKVLHLNNNFQVEEVTGAEFFTISGQGDRTMGTINFANIAKVKGNDGIYVVSISARDYAGHVTNLEPELRFSLNRFGSSFLTEDSYTMEFLAQDRNGDTYRNSVDQALVIKEINPNRVWSDSTKQVEGSAIVISVNGNTYPLVEGKDYNVTVQKMGDAATPYYVYTYAISPDNFYKNNELLDGRYSILFYSEDESGNRNTNEANEAGGIQKNMEGDYTGKIQFALDSKNPIISVVGIASDETYNAEFRKMEINVSDNSPAEIAVYLNGELVNLSESAEALDDNRVWLVLDEITGNYILNVVESNSVQSARIEVFDAAGNSTVEEIVDFLVTTNAFVRFFNNSLYVGLLGAAFVSGTVAIVYFRKRKKVADKV